MLQLSLAKPGETTQNTTNKISLNLGKPSRFSVECAWDCPHDLDVHALLTHNDGNGAKVTDVGHILSTYNCKKTNPNGNLPGNSNGSFSTLCGSLTHSGDSRTGIEKAVDEIIMIDGAKIPSGINEIPIFVTIHDKKSPAATFAQVKESSVVLKDDGGKVLGEYKLTNEFGQFNAVQMGSLILGSNGWEFAAVGSGFKGDFNTILGHFS